jgi:hypothetical protein
MSAYRFKNWQHAATTAERHFQAALRAVYQQEASTFYRLAEVWRRAAQAWAA